MSDRVLFIGGTDSSAGAGLLRDTVTAASLDAQLRVVVTAVTAQTDESVPAIHLMPPELVTAQMEAAGNETIAAVKIGMLGNSAIVDAVARSLPEAPLVLDPVLRSSSGRALLVDGGLDALIRLLLPRATLLTPNLPELQKLAGRLGLASDAAEGEIVRALQARGCAAVLVKGGHAEEETDFCEDRLHLADGKIVPLSTPRFDVALRGTGCQLAGAIAVHLARGEDLKAAVTLAKDLVRRRFKGVSPT